MFWNEEYGAFCAWDVRTGGFSHGFSNASALCFYAGTGTTEQRAKTIAHIERIAVSNPIWSIKLGPDVSSFESQRYWCGPLWCQMNYMIAQGLS